VTGRRPPGTVRIVALVVILLNAMSCRIRAAPFAGAAMLCVIVPALPASADEAGEASLAMKLSNPVAALISVPMQLNYDQDIGPVDDGDRWLLNVQPVIPFDLNDDWNLISRTILPVVRQSDIFPGAGSQTGIGDTVQSVFLSPSKVGSVIWGAGPVFLLPTATETALGAGKWGAGPTFVALKQQDGLTMGMLANHIWSFAGPDDRQNVSATFVQPFVSFTTKEATTYGATLETTYDWKRDTWTIPLNLTVAQLVRLGKQPAQVGIGGRYYVESPAGGPDWGLRLNFVLLFPA